MAAVLDKKDPAAKAGSQVDEQLAEATSRIRFHDLALGGLVLGAIVLAYATAMILLDRYLVLPEWVRQLSLAGLVAAAGGIAYLTVIRPLRREINPFYAAVQVERTIEDSKNSVVGYVDARAKGDVHPSVKAAVAARAARSMGKADLNRAVDHRSLLYAGGAAIVFLLTLVVLFFVFGLGQFGSLLGRAFAPVSSDAIATRTKLTLTKPESGDVTITAGQSMSVGVHVGGKVPDPATPGRLRVLIRHNPADPNYEEVPLEKGDDSRDWQVRVPDHLVQNGFWYKVAGGDAVTDEHRVTVRSLPLFTDFETAYEFPAYLRRSQRTDRNPWLDAPRGTKVVMTARTNREVKDGRMAIEPTGERITGTPVPGKPDALRFELKLKENGSYKLSFTSMAGERNAEQPPYSIRITEDARPTVEIKEPEQDEVERPANGQLAVDGTVGDDYGIVGVRLRLRLVTDGVGRMLQDLPFDGGKSLRRETDKSYPTDLLYKGSVDLAKVTDAAGQKVELKPGMDIEFWLEAIDNCTEVKLSDEAAKTWGTEFGNVGKSAVRKLRLGEPKTNETDQANLEAQKQQRQQREQEHNKQQQKQFEKEDRNPEGNPPPQPPQGDNAQAKKEDGKEPPKNPENKGDNPPKTDGTGMNDPMQEPNGGMPETAPPPSQPGDKELQNQADKLKEEIDKQNQSGGQGRGNPNADEKDRTNPDQPKENPPGGPPPDASKPKDEPDPMGGMKAGEPKAEGNVEPPPPPSAPKPDPKPTDPMGGNQNQPPPGEHKDPPPDVGGNNPGQAKPEPQPKGDNKAGQGKPASDKKDGAPPPDPAAGAGERKPQPKNDRGTEREPTPQPNAGDKAEPGEGKPEKAPNPAETKPGPQKTDPSAAKPDADQPKPDEGKGPDAADKPNTPQPGGNDKVDPGEDKPSPGQGGQPNAGEQADPEKVKDDARNANNPDEGKRNKAKGELDRELGPRRSRDAADAGKDLDSPDEQKRKDAENKLERLTREANEEKRNQKNNAQARTEPEKKSDADELSKKKKDKENPGGGQSGDNDPKDAGNAAKDLATGDEAKKNAARDKLDKSVGKANRQQAEQQAKDIEKDLKSDDMQKRDAAQKKLDDLAKKAEQQADEMNKKNRDAQTKKEPGKGAGKEPTKEEVEAMRKKAEDLVSDDKAKREAAEKEFDQQIGEQDRKELQKALEDAKSGDPQRQEQAKKKFDEMAKKAHGANGPLEGERQPPKGTASDDMPLPKKLEDDPKHRLKSAELQLRKFKEVKDDPDLLNRAGFKNAEEFERFLKGHEEMVERLRTQVADAERNPPPDNPGAPTGPVKDAGDARKLDKANATETGAGVTGPTFAPPGFDKAQQKFQEKAPQYAKPRQ